MRIPLLPAGYRCSRLAATAVFGLVSWVLMLTPQPVLAVGWKAGVARAVITPQKSMWMAGYGSRTEPSAGKFHDLWIRVLVLESADGHRGVILSSDTLGISQPIYEAVVRELQERHGLSRSQVMLNASHTHCGPVLKQALYDIYPLDEAQTALVDEYSAWLIQEIVSTVSTAIGDLQPATVSRGVGTTDFAVNRRTNREPDVPMLREQNLLMGPVDHTVPVLAVHRADQKLVAVVFAYACHNTVLSFQQWCGDYAGFAQYALESRHPDAVAMFVMGCGADQNPLPRRTVELAQGYGNKLADAVDAVLAQSLTTVAPKLATAVELTPLKFGPLPPPERMQAMASAAPNYQQRWASRLLKMQESQTPLPTEYPYPVQAWRLGDDLLWLTLGGEVVVDYSLALKSCYGWDTWVTSYANDVMAYIPSERVLLEGGYEGQSSMYVYGQPAERWAPGVEERVTAAAARVVELVNAPSAASR